MSYNPLAAQSTQSQANDLGQFWNSGPSDAGAQGPVSVHAPPSPEGSSSHTSYRPPDLMWLHTSAQHQFPTHLVHSLEQQRTGSASSVLQKQYNPLLQQQMQHQPQPLPAALPGVLGKLTAGRDASSTSHASNAQQMADPWDHAGLAGSATNSISPAAAAAAAAAAANTGGTHDARLQEKAPAHQFQELSLQGRVGDLQQSTADWPLQEDDYWLASSDIQQHSTSDTAVGPADDDDPWAAVLSKPQGEAAGGQAAAHAAVAIRTAIYDSMQVGGNPKRTGTETSSWENVMASNAAVGQPQQDQRSMPADAPAATTGWGSSDNLWVAAAVDSWGSLRSVIECQPDVRACPQQQHLMSAGAGTDNWEAVMAASTGPQAVPVLQPHSNRDAASSASTTIAETRKRDASKASTGPQSAARAQQHYTTAACCCSTRQQSSQQAQETEEPTGRAGSSVIEMALTQLRHERPDVAVYMRKDLRARISAMPLDIALAAVGELAELPQGWADGLGMIAATARGGKASSWDAHKHQQKSAAIKHVEGVAARAAAHAQASGSNNKHNRAESRQGTGNWGFNAADAGGTGGHDGCKDEQTAAGDEDGWVTIPPAGSSPVGAGSSCSSSSSKKGGMTVAALRAATGAGARDRSSSGKFVSSEGIRNGVGRNVAAAWAKLESERPDVMMCLDERHRAVISTLGKEKQVQVLTMLHTLSSRHVDSSKPRTDVAKHLTMLIANHMRMVHQTDSSKTAAGLKQICQKHPQLVPYMDDQLLSRLAALNPSEALIAFDALDKAGHDANARWQQRCTNHSAWLNRTITNALRAAGQ